MWKLSIPRRKAQKIFHSADPGLDALYCRHYSQLFHMLCLEAWALPMFLPCLDEFSGAVQSCFTLSRQTSWTEVLLIQPEDSLRPLFKELFIRGHGSGNLSIVQQTLMSSSDKVVSDRNLARWTDARHRPTVKLKVCLLPWQLYGIRHWVTVPESGSELWES